MRVLPLLSCTTFVIGTGVYTHVGLLLGIAGDLGVTVASAGLLGMVAGVLRAAVSPVAASRVATWDRRRALAGGMVAYALANIGSAAAHTLWWMMLSQAAAAVAAAIVTPLALAIAVSATPPDRQGRALASVMGGLAVAMVVGIPFGTAVGSLFGWRVAYLIVATGAFLVAGALWRAPLPKPRERVSPKALPRGMAVPLLLGVMCSAMAAAFTVVAYIGPLLSELAGVDGAAVGGLQVGMGLGSVLGLVVGGNASDKLGRGGGALALGMFAQVAMLLLFTVVPTGTSQSPPIAGLVLLLTTTATFMVIPMVQVRLIATAPESRALVLALNGSAVFLGQGLGAAVGAATLSVGTLHHLAPAGAVVAALGALMALSLRALPAPSLSRT